MYMKIFSRIKKHPTLTGVIVGVVLLVASFGVAMKTSRAFLAGAPFGGMITGMTYCPVSMNIAFVVAGVKGGLFTYEPELSTLFQYWMMAPGSWIVGTFWPGTGYCLISVFPPIGFPTEGTVVMAGTSL